MTNFAFYYYNVVDYKEKYFPLFNRVQKFLKIRVLKTYDSGFYIYDLELKQIFKKVIEQLISEFKKHDNFSLCISYGFIETHLPPIQIKEFNVDKVIERLKFVHLKDDNNFFNVEINIIKT